MPHTFSTRVQPEVDVNSPYWMAWYTVDGVELWTGFYRSQAMAQNAVDRLVTHAQARFPAELTLVSIAPTTVSVAGPPVTVTVTGSGFLAGSTILIRGAPQPTTFVDSTKLTTSYDPTTVANVTFKVQNPDGAMSAGLPMIVTP